MLAFLFLITLPAHAATAPGFDLAAWQKLAARAAASTLTSEDDQGREYRSLQRFTDADPLANRRADYISAVGSTQTDGTFHVDHLEIVTEKWVIEPDNVKSAEQWAYAVKTDGNVTFVLHRRLTEEFDGSVLGDDRLATPALTDPALLKQLGAKITEWEAAQ